MKKNGRFHQVVPNVLCLLLVEFLLGVGLFVGGYFFFTLLDDPFYVVLSILGGIFMLWLTLTTVNFVVKTLSINGEAAGTLYSRILGIEIQYNYLGSFNLLQWAYGRRIFFEDITGVELKDARTAIAIQYYGFFYPTTAIQINYNNHDTGYKEVICLSIPNMKALEKYILDHAQNIKEVEDEAVVIVEGVLPPAELSGSPEVHIAPSIEQNVLLSGEERIAELEKQLAQKERILELERQLKEKDQELNNL